jgi:cytochrome oxidase Cu insertion factor (SCO1/SenC/PrrC family)/thiol-disulfide isomerase/thioredoxin
VSGTAHGTGRRAARPWLRPALTVAAAFAAAGALVVIAITSSPSSAPTATTQLLRNPDLDPGTAYHRVAPNFALTDQFGRAISLRSYSGKVVLLAFNDAQCTTICPLTTAAMVQAKALLGAAGSGVQLLGVNANPQATAVRWVHAYSQAHGLLHQWDFLTGSLAQLKGVWHAYHIAAQVIAGQIDHTPAVYVIDRRGRIAELYEQQMAYASVPQQAQVYAHELARLLPGHPRVRSHLSYASIQTIGPAVRTSLPRAGGGTVRLGSGSGPQLLVFFATWLRGTSDISGQLESIGAYQRLARVGHLPPLTAIDEGSVEPSPAALSSFLRGLPHPLAFGVGIDRSGRVADGYEVQDQPWFVLSSRAGRILWYWDATTQGWLTPQRLAEHVGAALSSPPTVKAPTRAQTSELLAGSPGPLAALHRQAGHLLGGEAALAARLRALRGYPIVLNVWASWCPGCRAEWPLLSAAAARFGRRVAFVGADVQDPDTASATSWLAANPVSYPSYVSPSGAIPRSGVLGLPTTIFIDAAGNITNRQIGAYDSQGSLDADISRYAM